MAVDDLVFCRVSSVTKGRPVERSDNNLYNQEIVVIVEIVHDYFNLNQSYWNKIVLIACLS